MKGFYIKGERTFPVAEETYSCVIVAQGTARWNGQVLEAGQGILLSGTEPHRGETVPSRSCLFLSFSERELLRVFANRGIRADGTPFYLETDGEWIAAAEFFFAPSRSVDKTARAAAMIELILSDLREEEATSERAGESYVRFVEAYIREHLGESIQVDALAEELGISRGYLRNVFFAVHGMSPREYLTEERLRAAKALLREGGLTVGEVAHRVGYEDVLQFSRIFKKHTDRSPSEYRLEQGAAGKHRGRVAPSQTPATEQKAPAVEEIHERPKRKQDPVWLF